MKFTIRQNLLVVSFSFALAGSLGAALRVWDGGAITPAPDPSFSNPLNWDGDLTAPVSNVDTLEIGVNTVGATPFIGFNTGEFRTASFTFAPTATTAYTVTAGSFSDSLTLTATGVTLQNSSPVRQTFFQITTSVGAATQTWNGGAQGLVMAQVDLGNNRVLTFDGTGTSSTTRNEIRGGITGTGTSGLTKIGTGTLVLDNPGIESDYTGNTTVVSGRLQLGRSDQIPNTSKLVLNGGIFDTGGFSDTIGALVLGGSATIDFGVSNTVSLIFGDSHLELWSAGLLNILNFTVGADSLRFGTDASALTSSQLAQISFNGMPAGITSTGFLQPIPEPGVAATFLLGLGIVGLCRRSRNRKAVA